jgi:hypothetical protein
MTQRATRHRLGPHFVVEEFDSRDGARVPPRHERALRELVHWWLEPLRSEFGPVTVHSGYRSASHNLAIGGASRSVHLLTTPMPNYHGRHALMAAAADVTCAEGSPELWAGWAATHRTPHQFLSSRRRGGIGRYPTFVHLDTGARRDWWL